MTYPAPNHHTQSFQHRQPNPRSHWHVVPDVIVPMPKPRRRRKSLLRGLFLITVFGGGWLILEGPAIDRSWLAHIEWHGISPFTVGQPSEIDRDGTLSKGGRIANQTPFLHSLEAPADMAPRPDSGLAAPPVDIAPEPPVATAAQPPLPVDHPLRQLANQAGLHPGLSDAVLSQLSESDLHNAAQAIRRALAAPSLTKTVSWPHSRKNDEALFNVHFVKTANAGCWRYVVTIEKARWLTTALPMEKCATDPPEKPSHQSRRHHQPSSHEKS